MGPDYQLPGKFVMRAGSNYTQRQTRLFHWVPSDPLGTDLRFILATPVLTVLKWRQRRHRTTGPYGKLHVRGYLN